MAMRVVWCALVGATAATVNVPILHFPPSERSGTYMDLRIGTPPQTVSVLFDTGSSTLAVGTPTTSGSNPICEVSETASEEGNCVIGSYTPSQSSSVSYSAPNCQNPTASGKCPFNVAYGTGAYGIDGDLVNDVLHLGSMSATVNIGSITSMYDSWQQIPSNGIFGVGLEASNGYGNCNPTCEPTAMTTFLQATGEIDTFALCLGTYNAPGLLSLGGYDTAFMAGDMQYISFDGSEGYYAVQFTGVGVNGVQLCSGSGCTKPAGSTAPTIVDTGTPPLLLYETAYNALLNSAESCTTSADCLINLEVGDACLSAAGLMTCNSGKCALNTNLVTSINANENGGASIIGNAALTRFYIEFDRTNSRIGFAERSSAACSVPCSAFLSATGCAKGQCTWSNGQCSGGQGVGNTAGGSTVSSGSCGAAAGGSSTAAPPATAAAGSSTAAPPATAAGSSTAAPPATAAGSTTDAVSTTVARTTTTAAASTARTTTTAAATTTVARSTTSAAASTTVARTTTTTEAIYLAHAGGSGAGSGAVTPTTTTTTTDVPYTSTTTTTDVPSGDANGTIDVPSTSTDMPFTSTDVPYGDANSTTDMPPTSTTTDVGGINATDVYGAPSEDSFHSFDEVPDSRDSSHHSDEHWWDPENDNPNNDHDNDNPFESSHDHSSQHDDKEWDDHHKKPWWDIFDLHHSDSLHGEGAANANVANEATGGSNQAARTTPSGHASSAMIGALAAVGVACIVALFVAHAVRSKAPSKAPASTDDFVVDEDEVEEHDGLAEISQPLLPRAQ